MASSSHRNIYPTHPFCENYTAVVHRASPPPIESGSTFPQREVINVTPHSLSRATGFLVWREARLSGGKWLSTCTQVLHLQYKYKFEVLVFLLFFSCHFLLLKHYIWAGNIKLFTFTTIIWQFQSFVRLQIKIFAYKTYKKKLIKYVLLKIKLPNSIFNYHEVMSHSLFTCIYNLSTFSV